MLRKHPPPGFNPTLVRLRLEILEALAAVLAGLVSIPRWFD